MSSIKNVLLNISMVTSFFQKLSSFNTHSLKVGHGDWLIPNDAPLTLSNLISLLTSIHITKLIKCTLEMHLITPIFHQSWHQKYIQLSY